MNFHEHLRVFTVLHLIETMLSSRLNVFLFLNDLCKAGKGSYDL